MATVYLSPIGNGQQYLASSGLLALANGGTFNTYAAGTSTPTATYTTSAGSVANPTSIPIGPNGALPNEVWLVAGQAYKFIILDALSNQIGPTWDNISGIGDTSTFSFTQPQAGSQAVTLSSKLQQIVSVSDFTGYDPTGSSYSTAAIQSASNAFNGAGGIVWIPSIYQSGGNSLASKLKSAAFSLGIGVTLMGSFNGNAATVLQGVGATTFTSLGGAIALDPSATITMSASSSIKGCVIYNNALVYPTAGSGGFSGTAITVAGPDVYVGYTLIVGFAKGIFSSGFERGKYEFVLGDNNTGIEITACFDVPKLQMCHMWPFGSYQFSSFTAKVDNGSGGTGNILTVTGATTGPALAVGTYVGTPVNALITAIGTYTQGAGGTCTIGGAGQLITSQAMTSSPFQNFARTGDAYYLHDTVDGPQLSACFSFGYLNGFHFKNISTAHIQGCFADNTLTHASSTGFLFEGGINTASVVACGAWSSSYGYQFNMTAGQMVHLGNCTSEGVTLAGVNILSGHVRVNGCEFIAMPNAAILSNTGSLLFWDQNTLAQISGTPINVTVGGTTTLVVGEGNYWIDGALGAFLTGTSGANNTLPYQLPSAAAMALPQFGNSYQVTGTTTINSITGGYIGRRIRLEFTNNTTVSYGASADQTVLNWGTSFIAISGATLSLIHDGTKWVEIGRGYPSGVWAGWGTSTGGAAVNNYPGASATLLQTSTAMAAVIAALKSAGIFTT